MFLDGDFEDWPDFDDFFDHQALIPEHYEEVVEFQHRWQWTGRSGNVVDMRHIPLQYAMNLLKWMEDHDSDNTPYMETGQYEYIREKIAKNQAWIDLAKKVLQGPKYTWQTLKTYNSTSVSSASSRETPERVSRSRRRRSPSHTSSTTTGE